MFFGRRPPPAPLSPGWLARAVLADVSARTTIGGPLCLAEPLRRLRLRPDALPLCGRRRSTRSSRPSSKVVRLAGLALLVHYV